MNGWMAVMVLVALAGRASADPAADRDELWALEPSITRDGRTLVVPYQAEDNARGEPNLALRIYDRRGRIVTTHVVRMVDQRTDDRAVWRQERVASKRLRTLRTKRGLVPLAPVEPTLRTPVRIEAADVQVELSGTGDLTLTAGGARRVRRTSRAWTTEPTAAQQRQIRAVLDRGELACFNAAELGDVWLDRARRAAVVQIRYHGNDSCWAPDSERVVLTW